VILRDCRFAHAHRLGSAALVPGDPAEIKRAQRASVLVLDDLGREEEIRSNPVRAIIAERHAEERMTWITKELTPPEIAERYGRGIARRICERLGHAVRELVAAGNYATRSFIAPAPPVRPSRPR